MGDPMKAPLDGEALEAAAKAVAGFLWAQMRPDAQADFRETARKAITAYLAALPAPPGDLVGALRECRDLLERWISYGGEDSYRGSDTVDAITRADAALASGATKEDEDV